MKKKKTSAASVRAIITEKTSTLESAILSEITLPVNIRDYATPIKNRISGFSIKVDDILEKLQKTIIQQSFLQYDSWAKSNNRFIIFSSEESKSLIQSVESLIIDRTFKSSSIYFTNKLLFNVFCFENFFHWYLFYVVIKLLIHMKKSLITWKILM